MTQHQILDIVERFLHLAAIAKSLSRVDVDRLSH
jgi:hypothetical protein